MFSGRVTRILIKFVNELLFFNGKTESESQNYTRNHKENLDFFQVFKFSKNNPGLMARTCNPDTRETEAGGLP